MYFQNPNVDRWAQEAYNHIVGMLRKQGVRAIDSDGIPRYRISADIKSPYGWLVDDDVWSPALEGCRINTTALRNAIFLSDRTLTNHTKRVVRHLQYTHDNMHPRDWEQRFRMCADRYNLTYRITM